MCIRTGKEVYTLAAAAEEVAEVAAAEEEVAEVAEVAEELLELLSRSLMTQESGLHQRLRLR
jgi:hypothetical protein